MAHSTGFREQSQFGILGIPLRTGDPYLREPTAIRCSAMRQFTWSSDALAEFMHGLRQNLFGSNSN